MWPALALTLFALGGQAALAQSPRDPLIGTWVADLAKSKFFGDPPKSVKRTYDYTEDGLILVTRETINAQGKGAFLHWIMSLDGKEHGEYNRASGEKPTFYLSGKAVDAHTKKIHDRKADGTTIIDYTYVVSEDGNTLTISSVYTADGKTGSNIEVYNRLF
jgi:hypothetical protein